MSFALLAALTACTQAPETKPEPTEAPEPSEAPEPEARMAHPGPDWTVRKHMNEHFAFVTDALFATFGGDLDGLHAQAKKLAEHEPIDDAPAAWTPYIETMKARATELEKVETIDDAAKGLVKLADTCASCHSANKGPDVSHKDLITNPELFGDAAMDRHQWAAYLMWIGLVVPNDEIWAVGTKALAHPKGALPEIPEAEKPLEMRVHDLAARASKATDYAERGAVYAEFLTTCSECHTKLGVKLPR
ncbi:MAG: hypothetical protein H6737_05645 [Alphaproteobacteria bacterium]|nr:hypothetical protein [Alphaproteobacteria bacterium]